MTANKRTAGTWLVVFGVLMPTAVAWGTVSVLAALGMSRPWDLLTGMPIALAAGWLIAWRLTKRFRNRWGDEL